MYGTTYEGHSVVLLKPMTFMNLSGRSVTPCSRFFDVEPQHILVAHDELDLAYGDLRLKAGGGLDIMVCVRWWANSGQVIFFAFASALADLRKGRSQILCSPTFQRVRNGIGCLTSRPVGGRHSCDGQRWHSSGDE